jgi:tetratricopeptide (TPR) repeat protein
LGIVCRKSGSIEFDGKGQHSPLLREDIAGELGEEASRQSHHAAVSYYQALLSREYALAAGAELIAHALNAGLNAIAIAEGGGRLLPYLRHALAYTEALALGNTIRSHVSKPMQDDNYGTFMYELGGIYDDLRDAQQAIGYYEQALAIDKEAYGDRHPNVARTLNNIGSAWYALGDSERAKDCFQQAYSIFRECYGDAHPHTKTVKKWLDGVT